MSYGSYIKLRAISTVFAILDVLVVRRASTTQHKMNSRHSSACQLPAQIRDDWFVEIDMRLADDLSQDPPVVGFDRRNPG